VIPAGGGSTPGCIRYPYGGGLSAQGRARREKLRLQAAQIFDQGIMPVQVARKLRVSIKSAYQWRRRWRAGGPAALASKGAGGAVCRLDDRQQARLNHGAFPRRRNLSAACDAAVTALLTAG
jgi:hypothetical protein